MDAKHLLTACGVLEVCMRHEPLLKRVELFEQPADVQSFRGRLAIATRIYDMAENYPAQAIQSPHDGGHCRIASHNNAEDI